MLQDQVGLSPEPDPHPVELVRSRSLVSDTPLVDGPVSERAKYQLELQPTRSTSSSNQCRLDTVQVQGSGLDHRARIPAELDGLATPAGRGGRKPTSGSGSSHLAKLGENASRLERAIKMVLKVGQQDRLHLVPQRVRPPDSPQRLKVARLHAAEDSQGGR